MSTVLLILLILACPLMMLFMMRGGHGHGGHAHGGHAHGDHGQTAGANGRSDGEHEHGNCEHCGHDDESLDDLKRHRDELDERIAAHEHEERAGVGA